MDIQSASTASTLPHCRMYVPFRACIGHGCGFVLRAPRRLDPPPGNPAAVLTRFEFTLRFTRSTSRSLTLPRAHSRSSLAQRKS